MKPREFQKTIWGWYRIHGRHDLPWRHTRDAYHILVSEIMLQQTQVSRVLEKYPSFIKRFPTIERLAVSSLTDVLKEWQGLGYNRRGKFLHDLAIAVQKEYLGTLPRDPSHLEKLPGIGRYTAGAVAAFAFNYPSPFIETNIRRVYLHFFFPNEKQIADQKILPLVEKTLPQKRIREWYWALMDYGAEALRNMPNPNRRSAHYTRQSTFRGSDRELRGKILRAVANGGEKTEHTLQKLSGESQKTRIRKILLNMVKEKLLEKHNMKFSISTS